MANVGTATPHYAPQDQDKAAETRHKRAKTAEGAVPPTLVIIPIFYEMRTDDLTSEANITEWCKSWPANNHLHGSGEQELPLDVASWPEALRTLKSLAGIPFPPRTWDYLNFIDKQVVPLIVKRLPPPPELYYREDNTEIKGRVRIAQAIDNMFSKIESKSKSQDGETHKSILGLYGIGGYGKTTICKIMVDFHNQQGHLNSRSALMQIPSNEEDDKEFVKQLKIATKKIAHIGDDLFSKINDVNEAINAFLRSIKGLVFFLAIDNMWEWSTSHVKQILKGLTPSSKVMVTSRSKILLERVFKEFYEEGFVILVEHIPTIDHKEALEALSSYSGIQSDVEVKYMNEVVIRCTFREGCHPLLLRAIASMLCRVDSDSIKEMQDIVDQVIIDNDIALDEDMVLSTLSTFSQKKLLGEKRGSDIWTIFLTVVLKEEKVVLKEEKGEPLFDPCAFGNIPILEWITLTSQRNQTSLDKEKVKVKKLIREIESLGMWRVKDIDSCEVEVHDLYKELALKKAKESGRYFWQVYDSEEDIIPANGDFSKVTSVLDSNDGFLDPRFVDSSVEKNFQGNKLEVLVAGNGLYTAILKGNLDLSPWVGNQLRILILHGLEYVTSIRGLGSSPNLQLLSLRECWHIEEAIEGLDALMELRILCLDRLGYDALPPNRLRPEQFKYLTNFNLTAPSWKPLEFDQGSVEECREPFQFRTLQECWELQEIKLEHLIMEELILPQSHIKCSLQKLKTLNIRHAYYLKMLTNLSGWTSLEMLNLSKCTLLKTLSGLSSLKSLKKLRLYCLNSLDELPNLGQLSKLETLELRDLEKLKGLPDFTHDPNTPGLKSLRSIKLCGCSLLKSLPDVTGLLSLETLNLESLQQLESLPDVSGIESLKTLKLEEIPLLKRLPDVTRLLSLKSLDLIGLQQLESLPDVSGLESLETLNLIGLQQLERLSDVSGLESLKTLKLEDIPLLKSLPDVTGLLSLKNLDLISLQQLESLPDVSGLESLKALNLRGLQQLERLPDVSGLESLITLKLEEIPLLKSLRDVSRLESLRTLRLIALQQLESLPDLTGLKSLETLDLKELPQLESLPDLTGLNSLTNLSLRDCGSLKSLPPSIKHLTTLVQFNIWNCGSLIPEPTFNLKICSTEYFYY